MIIFQELILYSEIHLQSTLNSYKNKMTSHTADCNEKGEISESKSETQSRST